MIPEWMQELCHDEDERLGAPFGIEWVGQLWACATDGRAALLVPVRGLPDIRNSKAEAVVSKTLSEAVYGPAYNPVGQDNLRSLLDWSAARAHEDQERLLASFYGGIIDRRLLWKYLRHLNECDVNVRKATNRDPFCLNGSGWILLCMGCSRFLPEGESAPPFPLGSKVSGAPDLDDLSMFELP